MNGYPYENVIAGLQVMYVVQNMRHSIGQSAQPLNSSKDIHFPIAMSQNFMQANYMSGVVEHANNVNL